jgi:DNA-binding SARP family transcriptional activator
VLIQAHLAEGNVAEAARQFRLYERLVTTELGVEPSPRIRALLPPFVRNR